VFLEADGQLRDQLTGYYGPEYFLDELRRIKRNEGTFTSLRARIQADAGDLDARWGLACKLRRIGDLRGYEGEVSEIRERDPQGKARASRRLRLSELYYSSSVEFELEPLYEFVRAEKDDELLFEAWSFLWDLEAQAARSSRDAEKARAHELKSFAAARALWPLVPVEKHGSFGNNIAWSIYESRSGASREDLEFALQVAEAAVKAAPEHPAVVDTYACCLFAVGRREQAIEHVKRCITLDPQNPEWRERLAEFTKKP